MLHRTKAKQNRDVAGDVPIAALAVVDALAHTDALEAAEADVLEHARSRVKTRVKVPVQVVVVVVALV